MGVFFERPATLDRTAVKEKIKEALKEEQAQDSEADEKAEQKTNEIEIAPAGYTTFNTGRFVGATIIFSLIVIAAITTDALGGMDDSSTALWGLTGTIFGVVVGFLAGEKPTG
jgi:hypothetical protein